MRQGFLASTIAVLLMTMLLLTGAHAYEFWWPVSGRVSGQWGEDRGDHLHAGVDIAASSGTPIHAACKGQIVYRGWYSGYGYTIDIQHEGGYVTRYGHQSAFGSYGVGAWVNRGDVIGYVGSTGDSTGPHTHFEIRQGVTFNFSNTYSIPTTYWQWINAKTEIPRTYSGCNCSSVVAPAYAATYVGQSYPATMTAGSTAIVYAEYLNTGTATWGHAATNLGTQGPQDRASPFYNSTNWISPSRTTAVDEWAVAPGQVGRFTFILKAPDTPGVYVEKFRPVQEGVTWFGTDVTWTITVVATSGNITGTVRNTANGSAVPGATVAITGGSSTTTNSSGVYTFTGLEPGTYTLTVSRPGFTSTSGDATVTAGETTTKDFSLVSTDSIAPTTPSGLTATGVSPSQIDLSWTGSTDSGGAGLAGYIVYREGVEVGRTASTTYVDNGLPQNTNFSYYVKAYDNATNLSGQSNTATAATKPGAVPIFEDGFATINTNLWSAIVQSPMTYALPPVADASRNHGTFPGGSSIKTVDSGTGTQGCLLGHKFTPAFAAAKFETWFYDTSTNDASRQGLQVRCLTETDGIKAIYFVGTFSDRSYTGYSVGYYKVCGSGCTGWYWQSAVKPRSIGWHKFTIDFQPYTGAGNEVTFYIDGAKVGNSVERTLDTQIYGLNMVSYGYHYRINVPGWFDDCAMYASPPNPPTMRDPVALSTDSIRWSVTDNSNNEMGFKLQDAAQATVASATVSNGTGSTVTMDEGGLAPNTSYTRSAKAFNGSLDSLPTASTTRWTLSVPPTTSNVTCDKPTGWSSTDTFTFTAVGGFGAGTVSKYLYAWDTNPTHAWTGSEAAWNSGSLILRAPSSGSYYLHVKGCNGENVENGTLDLGPYSYQAEPPTNPTSVVETHGVESETWQSTVSAPSFTWSGATAGAGIAGYLVYFGPDSVGTSSTLVTTAAYTPAAVSTGRYYLRLRTQDNLGNLADEWETLFTFQYDSSVPSTPVVADEGSYSGSKTKLSADWFADDPDSGVVEYQYAVGTSVGGTDVVGWTSAGSATGKVIDIPEPGLAIGPTYYVSVKARNGAGIWSGPGSSNGIQVAEEVRTIAEAKALADSTPVALCNKVVTANLGDSYYIEETDRSSGILVLGKGVPAGALVTVGGIMGLSPDNERALLQPATVIESEPSLSRVPSPLFLTLRFLGGTDLNTHTPGISGGIGLNNVGLLVRVAGRLESIGDGVLTLNDGSEVSPIKLAAYLSDLSSLDVGDFVSVTGIVSLELDGLVRKPVLKVFDPSGIRKLN